MLESERLISATWKNSGMTYSLEVQLTLSFDETATPRKQLHTFCS